MKLFDEKGNELSIDNVVSDFIKNKAKEHNVDALELYASAWEDSIYISERDGLEFDVVIKDIEEIKIK